MCASAGPDNVSKMPKKIFLCNVWLNELLTYIVAKLLPVFKKVASVVAINLV